MMYADHTCQDAEINLTLSAALAQLNGLPTTSAVVEEVIASFNDPDLDVTELATKIGHDHGLTAKVLRVANSSFYGLTRQVGTIPSAVVVLGFGTIRTMIVAASMTTRFPPVQGETFDRAQFWQHSMRTAVCARRIARGARVDAEIAFTAGFLRDIGALILRHCIGVYAPTPVVLAPDLELAVLGAEAVKHWNFPDSICDAIRAQSTPEVESISPIGDIVAVADSLARCYADHTLVQLASTAPPSVWARFPISPETVEACVRDIDALNDHGALEVG